MSREDRLIKDVEELIEAFRRADKHAGGIAFVVLRWLANEGLPAPSEWHRDAQRLWRVLSALVCDGGLMGPGLHDRCASAGGCLAPKGATP